jgi:chromosome condensin MukBEF ATPase and DNA-binding subunit MukB
MAVGIQSKGLMRWLAPVLALLVVMQLTACGDKEPEQRKAFIEYLQNTVMRSGVKIPTLSEDQKQKFGNYAGDYAILVSFSQQLSKSVDSSLTPALDQVNQIRTAQDYMSKRDMLQQSIGALNLLGQQIQSAKSQADTARAALKQPDDLKVVYNQAYDKIVTAPANALMPTIPTMASFIQDLVQVGDFLQAQGTQVSFNNGGVQFRTPQQVTQYNTMMSSLVTKQQDLLNAQKTVLGVMQ